MFLFLSFVDSMFDVSLTAPLRNLPLVWLSILTLYNALIWCSWRLLDQDNYSLKAKTVTVVHL